MEENKNPLLSFKPEAPQQDKTAGQTLGDLVRAKYPATSVSAGAPLQATQKGSAFDAPVAGFGSKADRPQLSFKDYIVPVGEIYDKMGDGTYQARVKNYITGTNNEERLARQQTTGEKWSNGLKKLGLKTGTAVLGGVVGTVTGLANAISEGSLTALYTDDFNTMLDHYNEKLEYTLPNLVTEQERNMGVFESMGTANFWANDALGGLSFTLGAIVSEGIWGLATGGTSLIAKGALGGLGRWSTKALGANRALKAMSTYKAPTKALINKNTLDVPRLGTGSIGAKEVGEEILGAAAINKGATMMGAAVPKALNQARFIYTSAGYEAGVEARHYLKEVEDEWLHTFQENNGRKPNAQELAEFKVNLDASGNAVWAANLALVGSSNMAIFGKMLLGKTTKPAISNSAIKRQLFGVGYDMEKGAATAVKANMRQKIAGKAYSILRAPVIEGVYEEGGQSIAAKAVKDYVLSGYDVDSTQENLSMIDSLIEGFKQTYGTTQGQKEVAIGMIIGLFGGGISTGGRFNEISSERANIQQQVDYRNTFTPEQVLASQIMSSRIIANNKILKATQRGEEARRRGDLSGEFLAEQQAILASVERDAALQGTKQGIADFEAYLNTVDNAQLAEDLGIEESEVGDWKANKLEEYKGLSQKYQDNERYVRALVGDQNFAGTSELNTTTEQIIKAITYNITIGEQSKEFTKKIVEDIKTAIAGEFNFQDATTALDIDMVLSEASSKSIDKYMSLSQKYKNLEEQKAKLETELLSAQNRKGTDPEAHASRLASLQERIMAMDNQMAEVRQNKETAFRALGIQNELFTVEDVDAQAQRVQELKEVVEGYKTSNPALYTTLTKLFEEYNKAKSNTVNFQNLTKELLDPKIRVDVINGWMSGILKKNKSLDESTKEFFREQIEQYLSNNVQNKAFSETVIDQVQTDSPEEDDTLRIGVGDEMSAPVEPMTPIKRLSPLEALKKKITDVMNTNVYTTTYIGDNFDEAVKAKPSQEDVNRYEELVGKLNSKFIPRFSELLRAPKGYFKANDIETGLTVDEIEELKELQTKLSNWKVLEGSVDDGGNSIADMILLVEQLEAEVEKADTKKEITDEEYGTIKESSEREAQEEFETSEAVQSPDQAVVRLLDDKGEAVYSFSHLDITTMTRLFPESTLEAVLKNGKTKFVGQMSAPKLAKIAKQEGQKFVLNTSGGALEITIGKRSRLKINKESFDSLINSSNIAIVKYGSGGYLDVYERLENGDLIPLKGDFSYASAKKGEVIELVPEVVNNVQEGQILITRLNRNDTYNKGLIDAYQVGEKTEEDFNQLMNDLHIYITDQRGQVIGSLRASNTDLPDTTATKNLIELRRKAVNMLLDENNTDDYFSLNESVPVRTVLIGSPNFVIGEDNRPKHIDFTDTALDQVEDVGYYQGETLKLRNMDGENVIKTFLPKTSAEKTPVVIIQVNGKSVAFPVGLRSTAVDKTTKVNQILGTELPISQKLARINEVLIANGLRPADYAQNSEGGLNLDIDRVLEDLSQVADFPNVEDWLDSSYKISTLRSEAQIAIDLDNKPFHLSKVMIDLSQIRTIGEVEQMQEKYDNIEDREIKLREDIQSAVAPILEGMNNYPDVDDVLWTNVLFSENELYRNPETDVERRHNVNLLKDALYKDGKRVSPPKAVREAYGDEFLETLRQNLEELDRVIELKRQTRATIKDATVSQQKDNQNTAC